MLLSPPPAFRRVNFGPRFSGARLGSASTTQGNFGGLWIGIAVWLRVLDVDVSQSLVGRAAWVGEGLGCWSRYPPRCPFVSRYRPLPDRPLTVLVRSGFTYAPHCSESSAGQRITVPFLCFCVSGLLAAYGSFRLLLFPSSSVLFLYPLLSPPPPPPRQFQFPPFV
jgi:hypothetical protein